MAFDLKKFSTRSISAMLFVLVMLFGILYSSHSFFILFLLVQSVAVWEFSKLLEFILKRTFVFIEKLLILFASISMYSFIALLPTDVSSIFNSNRSAFLFYLLGFCIGLCIMLFFRLKHREQRNIFTALGYISIPLALLFHARMHSLLIPMVLIFSIWTNDTMAYIGGSFFGKNPLAKNISPNKTIEGTIIGIVFAIIFGIIWSMFFKQYAMWQFICISLIGAIAGTIGDLIESKLKRLANVKDSGNIMPGHGGMLDRFDSLIFASSFVYLFTICFLPKAPFEIFAS